MDFTLDDDQTALADLAGRILTDKLPPERLRELEASDPDGFPADVWTELARADLLGLCLPTSVGGGGYGILEAALLCEQVGRAAAPLPFLATVVLGALPLARFGTEAQQQQWLPGVVAGDVVLTAALAEPGAAAPGETSATVAVPASTSEGDGWRLDGEKHLVPWADQAAALLVPARTDQDALAVFLVEPTAPGVSLERQETTAGEPQWRMVLDAVPAEMLGTAAAGEEALDFIVQHALAALCATQGGVCDAAVGLTARYTSEREQFGAKIATFQAVAQRAADAYIDAEAVRLTALAAAWRLSEGMPATDALAVAKFWAAEGAQRVVHAAQHLHGGIGVDVDYPLHRYFRWAKQLELTLGGGTVHLLRIGDRLAAEPI